MSALIVTAVAATWLNVTAAASDRIAAQAASTLSPADLRSRLAEESGVPISSLTADSTRTRSVVAALYEAKLDQLFHPDRAPADAYEILNELIIVDGVSVTVVDESRDQAIMNALSILNRVRVFQNPAAAAAVAAVGMSVLLMLRHTNHGAVWLLRLISMNVALAGAGVHFALGRTASGRVLTTELSLGEHLGAVLINHTIAWGSWVWVAAAAVAASVMITTTLILGSVRR